ncbi:MAG TPA: trypsin-like serine protease [Polyangiaceae bacterium]|nr:trypsin-like serine protease [Polyangiaceae bacterium]
MPPPPVHRSSRPSSPARAGALACAFAASACASLTYQPEAPEPEPAEAADDGRHSIPPPAPEMVLAVEDDFAVRVVTGSVTCTGALIADNRVLTAHHCVTARSAHGEVEAREVDPSNIHVELGGDLLPWGEVSVRAIVAPSCGYTGGDGDIAILVLSRPLKGIPLRSVDLDGEPAKGDALYPLGFGRCADASDGTYRKRRAGSSVQRVLDGRLEFNAAVCPGDSGGPALSEATGKIVGVVSRSVMDANEATLGLTELVRVDSFRSLFSSAAQIASGVSPAELPPVSCRR